MKTYTLLIVLTMLINIGLFSQNREDYSIEFIGGPFDHTVTNVSSTYWFGQNYTFWVWDEDDETQLWINMNKIDNDGHVSDEGYSHLADIPENDTAMISSCTYRQDLYVFFTHQTTTNTELKYMYTPIDSWFENITTISLDRKITSQISAVTYNDTIYLFFIDIDNIAKYYSLAYNNEQSQLLLVSEIPAIVDDEIDNCIGTIAAITFVNEELEEKILIATPTSFIDEGNQTALYKGTPGNFLQYDAIYSLANHHIKEISMAQGSVKGGSTENYNIQFGYTFSGDNHGLARCEYHIDAYYKYDWEELDHSGIYLFGDHTWFMEFYTKGSESCQKYLGQGLACGDGSRVAIWESDKLEYADETETVVPHSHGNNFFDLILVAEGAPPYTLNGYELDDSEFDGNPPSTFQYVKSSENSVSTSTTYSLGVEANMGLGPVTAGFKASFQESHGTSFTESNAISRSVIPPKINADSAGEMFYYYIAPTVVRERWVMKDYDGNEITPNRNLFFFKLNSPQMLELKYTLDHYGDNSPRAYDLETYKNRNPQNIAGVEDIIHEEVTVDFAGSQPSLDIDFTESHTDTHSQSYEVSVGVDAEYGIFSASASVTAGLEYHRERTTTYENGFHIEWLLFSPKNPDDENNIRMFRPTSWIMKTKDSSAYFINADFLFEEFKKYKPWFITYSIDSISHGNFTDPPYYIGENRAAAEKYNFGNYPNPCRDVTKFYYSLPNQATVSLRVYNAQGVLVSELVAQKQSASKQSVEFYTDKITSGLYYYRLIIDEDLIMGKIIKN
ncbi:MAG: T9SS type A sorting domain-containing protein [Bacteroidota bacterium]